jgi:superfamily I DNA/RNA helicase
MTIHQAKGLEFKCVIVPGLNEGILPHINSVEDLANGEADNHLQEEADGTAGNGGVEVFGGVGMRR